jgi:hypothetical protein
MGDYPFIQNKITPKEGVFLNNMIILHYSLRLKLLSILIFKTLYIAYQKLCN